MDYHVDLNKLSDFIVKYAKKEGFQVRLNADNSPPRSWFQIQMVKTGLFRAATGTRRSLDCIIRGHPEDFEVALGTGEWGKNILSHGLLGVMTLGGALLAMGIGTATYKRTEGKLWGKIRAQIQELKSSGKSVGHAGIKEVPIASSRTTRFCTSCGEELPASAKFCDACGTKLKR